MQKEEALFYLVGALQDGSVYRDKAARNHVVVFYQKQKEWLERVIAPALDEVFEKGVASMSTRQAITE